MLFLTEDADLKCLHRGRIAIEPTQDLVTIEGRRVLVEPNPVGRGISRCPNTGALIKPCLTTLEVKTGYSPFLRIGSWPICLDTVSGLTDGTPPGVVNYVVFDPGQAFVAESTDVRGDR
jgi:hypothetical protein